MNTTIERKKERLCEICLQRENCKRYSLHNLNCPIASSAYKGKGFRIDEAEKRKAEKRDRDEYADFVSRLKKVHSYQLKCEDFESKVVFNPLPFTKRKINSHNGTAVRIANGNTEEFSKHCEQCGVKFRTVNEFRTLCDDCWFEICQLLGVDYSIVTPVVGVRIVGR